MSSVIDVLKAIEATPLSQAILESGIWFPVLETVHVLALTLVFGTIAFVDLRLLGLASRQRSVHSLSRELLPWTWSAFGAALLSGGLLFISQPVKYWGNLPFRIKFALLALAGLNMLVFHFGAYRRVVRLEQSRLSPDEPTTLPAAARWAGGLSLLLWIGVVAAGRWIAFAGY